MEKRDYEVSFRSGKTMKHLGQDENVRLSNYLKSLGIEVLKDDEKEKTVRISATNPQYSELRKQVGQFCQILVVTPESGSARVSGTS